jgi:hypothetical protein
MPAEMEEHQAKKALSFYFEKREDGAAWTRQTAQVEDLTGSYPEYSLAAQEQHYSLILDR